LEILFVDISKDSGKQRHKNRMAGERFGAGQDPQRNVVPVITVTGRTVRAGDRILAKTVV
jgi:hypothetical protein